MQYRSYLGGRFDRTIYINGKTNRPYTREQAEKRVEEWNKGKEPAAHARVAHRYATPWRSI